MRNILIIYIIRLCTILLFAYLAAYLIPYKGFFPYKEMLDVYNVPKFIKAFANFDGLHYLGIAQSGYYQYQQAFFPGYPIAIKIVTAMLGKNYLIGGFLVSNLSYLGVLVLLSKILKSLRYKDSTWFMIFFVFFPTSFYFSAIYTESFFLLLLLAVIYFQIEKKPLLSAFCAFGCSLTRFIGLASLLFLIRFKKHRPILTFWVLWPIIGLLLYMLYLNITVHDPLYFLNSQPFFGANRSTKLILLPQVYFRYLKIFYTAKIDIAYLTAVLEFLFFNFTFVILLLDLRKRFKTHATLYMINLFSLFNLILPTLTGTFSSIPRYSLMSISMFFFLGELKSTRFKIFLSICFLCLQLMMLVLFIQGYFIS